MDFNLDTTLVEFSDRKFGSTLWTIRNAVEGVQVFGGIGSGKTSGSGRTLAIKYLAAGFGGLELTVKPEEKELWQAYCEETSRSNDLLIIDPSEKTILTFLITRVQRVQAATLLLKILFRFLKPLSKQAKRKKAESLTMLFGKRRLIC